MKQDLIKELENIPDFTIEVQTKRIDGEWERRYVWEICDGRDSRWEGFKTLKGCMKNLLKNGSKNET